MKRTTCPSCGKLLEPGHHGPLVGQVCPACGGCMLGLDPVRKAVRKDIAGELIAQVRSTRTEGPRKCPRCMRPMTVIEVPRGPNPVALQVCYPCEVVWFDPKEYEVLSAMYGDEEPPNAVDHKWKWALALLGMPVEQQTSPLLHRPWLTWILSGIIALVSIAAWAMPSLQSALMLMPTDPWRVGGLTLLTNFFVHAGLFHLASNLYFLIVFGANVEDYLGRSHYLLLLLLATLAGNLVYMATDTHPSVGASGGISGAVIFYGLQFSRVRLVILTGWLLWHPIRLRAWVALLIWLALQAIGAVFQMQGSSHVASTAHLGGAMVGFAFWLIWRNRLQPQVKPSTAAAAAGE